MESNTQLQDKALALFRALLQVNSTNPGGSEENMVHCILALLKKYGAPATDKQVQILHHTAGRASMVLTLPGQSCGKSVGFAGHLDTVPVSDPANWRCGPFSGTVNGTAVTSRGAADMKGGLTAMLLLYLSYATNRQKPPVTLRFYFTADEESGGLGVSALRDAGAFDGLSFLFICEPTACTPGVCEKGCMWTKASVHGKSSHASMPQNGINALELGTDFLKEAQKRICACVPVHPLLGSNTCCMTAVSSGIKINMIPDFADFSVDTRFLPTISSTSLKAIFEQSARQAEEKQQGLQIHLRYFNCREALETDSSHPGVSAAAVLCRQEGSSSARSGVLFYTDASLVCPYKPKLPFLILGPGNPAQCHCTNETADWTDIVRAFHVYRKWTDTCVSFL